MTDCDVRAFARDLSYERGLGAVVGPNCSRTGLPAKGGQPPNRWTYRFKPGPFWTALGRSQCVHRELAKVTIYPANLQDWQGLPIHVKSMRKGDPKKGKALPHIPQLARTVDHRVQKSQTRTHDHTNTTRPNETITRGPTQTLTRITDSHTSMRRGSRWSLECLN